MEMNTVSSVFIPENIIGKAVDLKRSVTEGTIDEATTTYVRACKRLQNPRVWYDLTGATMSAKFQLADNHQHDPHRLLALYDYLCIAIPGPAPSIGDGFDWVQVTKIQEGVDKVADESFGIQLAASVNPQQPSAGTAHFFREGATSSFVISRYGNTVTATYHGRNEKPNNDTNIKDIIRNTAVAAGAMLGLSEVQWSALLEGFLLKEIGGYNKA